MGEVTKEDQEISRGLPDLAALIKAELEKLSGRNMGFALVVFNTEVGSRMNYVSNCDRNEVVGAFKSMLTKWEAGMPDIPSHEIH